MFIEYLKNTLCYFVATIILANLAACTTNEKIISNLQNTPQDTLVYLNSGDNYIVMPSMQKQLAHNYLLHYFSPWTANNFVSSSAKMRDFIDRAIHNLAEYPGLNSHQQTNSKLWASKIAANANLADFPAMHLKAISIAGTNVRAVPTVLPSFNSPLQIGEFDNLQISYLPANTPVVILHVSQDRAWYLIATTYYIGWVDSHAIALATPSFIKTWQTGQYIVPTADKSVGTNLLTQNKITVRIGTLLPLYKMNNTVYQIYTADKDGQGNAVIKLINLPKSYAAQFPLQLTQTNIAVIANKLMSNPYGWAGLNGYRDCSSTIQDIMATFGIWLPRNSSDQARSGQYITMTGWTNAQKRAAILKYGIPFLTLIHLHGHIMLYIGERHGELYVFQDLWGLHTRSLIGKKPAIVGMTVITPLSFGRLYKNVPVTYLQSTLGIVTLIPVNKLIRQ